MKPKKFSLIILLTFSSLLLKAQQDIQSAANLASRGNFKSAIGIYSSILQKEANNRQALIARGFTYSWDHQFKNAVADFKAVLKSDPQNFDARKGLAYISLWKGDFKNAVFEFNDLIVLQPKLKELHVALALAHLNLGNQLKARAALLNASTIDPADAEVKSLIDAVRTSASVFEIDVMGGYSSADNVNRSGLRFLQISSQLHPKIKLSAKYDNSLSLDNAGLLINKTTIPYYAGSLNYKWSKLTATRVEVGYRNISIDKTVGASSEMQYGLEQVFYLKSMHAIKAGAAVIDPEIGEQALLLSGGYQYSFSKMISAGLDYFYADRKVFNTSENRILLSANGNLTAGKSISAGVYYGHSTSDLISMQGDIKGFFVRTYVPISNAFGIHAGIASEKNFLQTIFNVQAGIRFRLEK